MTGSNVPPGGGEKAAPKAQATVGRAADKPAVQPPRSTTPIPPNLSKPPAAKLANGPAAAAPDVAAPRPLSIGEA
ncbi:MAG: hypothetical protein WBE25_22200, partial [Xanthobacteraceae bacterium]